MANAASAAHALAHTARILRVIATKPDHPRRGEYNDALVIHRGEWRSLKPDQREEVAAYVTSDAVADLTEDDVTAARAALEA